MNKNMGLHKANFLWISLVALIPALMLIIPGLSQSLGYMSPNNAMDNLYANAPYLEILRSPVPPAGRLAAGLHPEPAPRHEPALRTPPRRPDQCNHLQTCAHPLGDYRNEPADGWDYPDLCFLREFRAYLGFTATKQNKRKNCLAGQFFIAIGIGLRTWQFGIQSKIGFESPCEPSRRPNYHKRSRY